MIMIEMGIAQAVIVVSEFYARRDWDSICLFTFWHEDQARRVSRVRFWALTRVKMAHEMTTRNAPE